MKVLLVIGRLAVVISSLRNKLPYTARHGTPSFLKSMIPVIPLATSTLHESMFTSALKPFASTGLSNTSCDGCLGRGVSSYVKQAYIRSQLNLDLGLAFLRIVNLALG